MRTKQLLEANAGDIIDIIDRDCGQFMRLSDDLQYVPVRKLSLAYSDSEVFNNFFRFKTQYERSSVVYDDDTFEYLDMLMRFNGHASRKYNMVATSSKGENHDFGVDKQSDYAIFPIGNFTYSYVSIDFNDHTEDTIPTTIGLKEMVDRLKEYGVYDDSLFRDLKSMYRAYVSTLSEDETQVFKLYDIQDALKEQQKFLNNIYSTNYVNAFNEENEIWFNCKAYYAMPYKMYEEVMRGEYVG